MRLALGLRRPKHPILGCDVAGRVVAVGKNVQRLQPGDEVFGDLSGGSFGAFAEYVCAREDVLVSKPKNLTFEQAAAVPLAAVTALEGLREGGGIQAGQRVLIHGASGGVGSFAVQIARAFEAEVTGACGAEKLEMVRSLGAHHVIDYNREDVTRMGLRYDLILDTASYRSFFAFRHALTPTGTYALAGGSTASFFRGLLLGPLVSLFGRRRFRSFMSTPSRERLTVIKDLIEAGKVMPFVDRSLPLSEVPRAIEHLEARRTRGKVVINAAA
jgi:NADPH:quinone reductase-like Zn-dependent oxidoreductase